MPDTHAEQAKADKARIFRERLAKAQAERAAAGIVTAPPERLDPIERAKRNPTSLKMAIAAKCYDCQGRDDDPAPRWRIGNCTSPDCPLWRLRPYQKTYGQPVPAVLRSSADVVGSEPEEDADDE